MSETSRAKIASALIQKELEWCRENAGMHESPEFDRGFTEGLKQAARLVDAVREA
jgi:hypothetical protein